MKVEGALSDDPWLFERREMNDSNWVFELFGATFGLEKRVSNMAKVEAVVVASLHDGSADNDG